MRSPRPPLPPPQTCYTGSIRGADEGKLDPLFALLLRLQEPPEELLDPRAELPEEAPEAHSLAERQHLGQRLQDDAQLVSLLAQQGAQRQRQLAAAEAPVVVPGAEPLGPGLQGVGPGGRAPTFEVEGFMERPGG